MRSSPHETRFDQSGTLHKPGPLGRTVRLALGIWLLYAFAMYWRNPEIFSRETPPHWTNLIGIGLALWLVPPVINIGFGTNWKAWPRYVAAGILVAWIIGNGLLDGSWWSPALGRFVWLFCLYTLGHLGVSFVLAAVIGTPGCEMRAIAHLWTLVTGRETKEHFCPGFLHGLDAWELERTSGTS